MKFYKLYDNAMSDKFLSLKSLYLNNTKSLDFFIDVSLFGNLNKFNVNITLFKLDNQRKKTQATFILYIQSLHYFHKDIKFLS